MFFEQPVYLIPGPLSLKNCIYRYFKKIDSIDWTTYFNVICYEI